MSTTSTPFEWLKQVNPDLLKINEFPLVGESFSFSWEELANRLAKLFDMDKVSLTSSSIHLRSAEELFEGFGNDPFPLQFNVLPLQGNAFWIMSKEEVSLLSSLLLTKKADLVEVPDHDFLEGFYRFIALEVLSTINQIGLNKNLSPILSSKTELPKEAAVCLDVNISIANQSFLGRLIVNQELNQSWKKQFKNQRSKLSNELSEEIEVTIHLENGRVSLRLAEWLKIREGDFLVLDNFSNHPNEENKHIMLTAEGRPLFRAQLNDGNIKILESPLYYEVNESMANNNENDEDENLESYLDFEEDEIDDDDESEVEEESDEEDLEEEDEDDEDEDEEFDIEDEIEKNKEDNRQNTSTMSPPLPTQEATKAPPAKEPLKPVKESKEKNTTPITPEQIPLTIVVELGRLNMTIKQLMELQPGNLLELGIHPENGVDLVINGKKIARGELIRLGETLGVRIHEIGKKNH